MRSLLLFITFSSISLNILAQFPPSAGQTGTTAIHKDSSVFTAWASGCTVERGPQDLSNLSLGLAIAGENWMATGKSGVNGIVSLGDGGFAVLNFEFPITNGLGWDFAIFENSFTDDFLELAFVEVSSDGLNYFRFPATSLTQDSIQVGGFGTIDATKIDNLAGKYRAQFGTPFDLDELKEQSGLDVNAITHVKIIDVVGSISNEFATFDQYGNKINDPFPTPFPSSGFDLDAVGVIHNSNTNINNLSDGNFVFKFFPNPASNFISIEFLANKNENIILSIIDITDKILLQQSITATTAMNYCTFDISQLPVGIYIMQIKSDTFTSNEKLIIY
ncbi:MAG: T9SS type A sorting domain-containing protein [Bacteroidales bacterium]|nr:T9SS type A sorting domain-containing protein [Bacteroidales bacterium]